MSPHPLPEDPSSHQRATSHNSEIVSLDVCLTATPSARLTHHISLVLNHHFNPPYTFLGSVDEDLVINLKLEDLGLVATEALARKMLKIKGVKRLTAKRVCSRRGEIFAISLCAT